MARLCLLSLLCGLGSAGLPLGAATVPIVDLSIGVINQFNADLRRLTTMVAADLDYRKNFEPDLVARFGPPVLPLPNRSFYPGLRVRPVLAEDGGQVSVSVWATVSFLSGANGYPAVSGMLSMTSDNGLATAPCSGAFGLNQIGADKPDDLSDKTRFPYFFRSSSPSSVLGRVMWEYVAFFSFRGFTVVSVTEPGMQSVKDGIVNAAAAVERAEAITALAVRHTLTETAADHAEWAHTLALARSAQNRLVVFLPALDMKTTLMVYLAGIGLAAPEFQLLLLNLQNGFTTSLTSAHSLNYEITPGSAMNAFLSMLTKINATDISSGIARYALDKWRSEPGLRFDPSKIPKAMVKSATATQFSSLATNFVAYHTFIRAFGELLNEGAQAQDIKGELLRAKIASMDFAGLTARATFDGNQDTISNYTFVSVNVTQVNVTLVLTSQPLARCVTSKANGTTTFTVSSLAAAPWATGDVSVTAPAGLAACPPGKHLATSGIGVGSGPGLCLDCLMGAFTSTSDEAQCTLCPAGTVGVEARDHCEVCPPGRYNPDKASTTCTDCMPGAVARSNGSVACELCPVGTYAETPDGGATACVPCGGGLTTAGVASLRADACVCPEGTYKPADGGPCGLCGEGLLCPVGSEEANIPAGPARRLVAAPGPYPQVLPGYFAKRSDPLALYRCLSDVACPGGPPESCAPHQQGLVCGECAAGYHRSPGGLCKACAAGDKAPLLLTLLAVFVCTCGLAIYSQHDEGTQRLTVVTAVLAAGQLVSCVQALSVIQQLKIVWVEPILSLWQLTAFFSLDLHVLNVQCVLHSDRPVTDFVMQLVGLPVVATLLALMLLLTSACKRRWRNKKATRRAFDVDRYLNLLGLLLVMTYISITVAMLRPLICNRHPNGLRHMASRPGVICWQTGEHRALVALSAAGVLFYPVALLASVARATLQYPYKAACGSLSHLNRFRFIFARFTPACYYWGFWYLLRNLALALIPVAAADSGTWQMMLLSAVLLVFAIMEGILLPWRTRLANVSEICSLVGLLLFLQAAGFLVGAQTGGSANLVSYMLLGIVAIMFLTIATVVMYAVTRICAPGVPYAAFLCHHKEGAGSLARWFKIQVGTVSKAQVFLDSDQLEELDLIVDTVHSRTRNLVILLTRFTLTRIWCAAEIASAVLHKVPVVQVACCDYTPCDAAFLDKLDDIWSDTQKHAVAQYGITLEHVRRAYSHLATLGSVALRRFAPMQEQRSSVLQALALCGICGPIAAPKAAAARVPACIAVAGASEDGEARTTCEVLRHLVQVRLEVTVVAVHSRSEAQAHKKGATYLLVLLTRGLLQDAAFMEVGLCFECATRPAPIELVTALADTNFAFPSTEFFEGLEKQGKSQERLAGFFRKVFNILALPLSPHGSEGIMAAQVGEICRRFREVGMEGQPTISDRSGHSGLAAYTEVNRPTERVTVGEPAGGLAGDEEYVQFQMEPDCADGDNVFERKLL